ncbi:hypothetical protein UFOVP71_116 [uncultured Caudovirales phage]|uniref:Uncharacterized protein n=1 Tax=uncultured Caudovirales phage TaxID=2100421 RepID=A0A6J5T9F8_9CAUD|nr:hypothetical protein UFOVP71_116 [uncultured Caudovirales phage]
MVLRIRGRSVGFEICPGGEMVYTGDLKSPVERHAGSSPAPGTKYIFKKLLTSRKKFAIIDTC